MSDAGVILRPGETAGPYRIERLLADAGLERVYLATTDDGASVAVKVPRFESSMDAELRRRFERQAETASRVAHPHLITVVRSGLLPSGAPFVAEEYMRGGSLQGMIARQPLDLAVAVRVCADVAGGLDALHAAGIIHRCLTPGCILLDESQCAKVGGFALAKDRDATRLTRAGHTVGAAQYIAPEQIRGTGVSPATDVYALGCILYEALTGAPPFAAEQGMKVLWAHLQTPPPDPRVTRPEISADVSWTIARALAKAPGDRPATAGMFAGLLEVARAGG